QSRRDTGAGAGAQRERRRRHRRERAPPVSRLAGARCSAHSGTPSRKCGACRSPGALSRRRNATPLTLLGTSVEDGRRESRRTPGDAFELLLIVRGNGTLLATLERAFAGRSSVKVILERRVGQRRSATSPVTDERRRVRTRRRIRRGTISPLGGFTAVRPHVCRGRGGAPVRWPSHSRSAM